MTRDAIAAIEELSKKQEINTNGDKVRQFDNKSLAYTIMCPHDGECPPENTWKSCYECTKEWLDAPVEEGSAHDE